MSHLLRRWEAVRDLSGMRAGVPQTSSSSASSPFSFLLSLNPPPLPPPSSWRASHAPAPAVDTVAQGELQRHEATLYRYAVPVTGFSGAFSARASCMRRHPGASIALHRAAAAGLSTVAQLVEGEEEEEFNTSGGWMERKEEMGW